MLVVGAGLTGLAHAWRRVLEGRDVDVLEASARPGGRIGTLEWEGHLVETGPGFCLGPARHLEALLRILPGAPRCLGPLPLVVWGRGGLVPSSPEGPLDRLRSRARGLFPRAAAAGGAPPVAEIRTLAGGMETLPRALASALGDRIHLATKVVALRPSRGHVEVLDADGLTWQAQEIALALPSAEQGRLLARLAPHHAEVLSCLATTVGVAAAVSLDSTTFGDVGPAGGFVRGAGTRGHVSLAAFASDLDPARAPPGRRLLQVYFGEGREHSMRTWPESTRARAIQADLERALGLRLGDLAGRICHLVLTRCPVPARYRGRLAAMQADLADAGVRLLGDHVLGGTIDRRCVPGAPLPYPVPGGVELV